MLGIFDTQEKTRCRFVSDETGQPRCLPLAPPSLAETGSFLDAGCTKPVYQIQASEPALKSPGQLVALPMPRKTPCGPVLYKVGTLSVLTPDTPVFGPVACAPGGLFPQDGYAFASAETSAPDRWASGTVVDGALVGGRLRVVQLQAADGARFDDHLVDTRWSKPCDLTATMGQCLPPVLAAVSKDFSDDQCTTPLARESGCDAAFIASNATLPARAIGAPWTGAVFLKTGSLCRAETTAGAGASSFFTIGPALDGDPVMPIKWIENGAGRLQLRELGGQTGPSVPVANTLSWSSHVIVEARYFDTVAGETCNPVWTPEGLVRCIPTSTQASFAGLFADATCKTPGYLCYDADCATRPMMDLDGDLTTGYRALSIHMIASVPTVFTMVGATCTPNLSGAAFIFGATTPVPWEKFPALTEINAR